MSSKSGAAGAIFIFENEKRHRIRPLKMDTLMVSAFGAFIHIHDESKHYLSHRFCTEEISLYTVHIKLIITKYSEGKALIHNHNFYMASYIYIYIYSPSKIMSSQVCNLCFSLFFNQQNGQVHVHGHIQI